MADTIRKRRARAFPSPHMLGALAVTLLAGCASDGSRERGAAAETLMPVLVEVAAPEGRIEVITEETARRIEALLDEAERGTLRRFTMLPLISVSVDAETLAAILAIPTVSSVSRDSEMQFTPQDKDIEQ